MKEKLSSPSQQQTEGEKAANEKVIFGPINQRDGRSQ